MRADKENVSRLLRTARGQIDGILRMIDEDAYCIDISNQVMAARSVLGRANREIISAHLEGCVNSLRNMRTCLNINKEDGYGEKVLHQRGY